MIFEPHTLPDSLSDYIEAIFHYKDFQPDHSIERVVPTGHVFIIFELHGFEYHTYNSETLKPIGTFQNVWISGMHKNFLSISARKDSEMLVIQFKTNGAHPFLHLPMCKLNNKVIAATDLLGLEILALRDKILAAKEVASKFKSVEHWLLGRFDESKVAPNEILDLLSQLKLKPISEHNSFIKNYPNSQKHLIHQFKTYFGLTPKVLHRIFRFNHLLQKIQNKEDLAWAQIAYEFGYSDQSHFIKEFKEFSGFNPQEFIQSGYHKEEPNFFPLDRDG